MKLKLIISYVGTQYNGWQIQENSPCLLTIQGELEKAFEKILKKNIRVFGASRTDSGVHADEQVAHCVLPFIPQNIDWQKALNTVLPYDIRIKQVEEVNDNFHAQFHSTGKIYSYALWTNYSYIPPKISPYLWNCGTLDFEKIKKALPYLIGTQDFISFQNRGTEIKHTVRTIHNIEILQKSEHEYHILFYGNGFLKQMIRNIMGLLILVGKHKIEPEQTIHIIQQKRKNHTIKTAPAQGLTLVKVLYE